VRAWPSRRAYDPSRGPYPIYAYKRVWGAVLRLLKRERAARRVGVDAGLDAAEELRDTSSPYDEDEEAKDQLKAALRYVTFRRFLGDAGATLAADPENTAIRTRVAQALRNALGALDEVDRRFIELRYWKGLSYAEIGEAMDMNEKAAQRLDERLRQRLSRDLKERGIAEPPASSAG
jgi:RNA polymerase sigma factor for flagellar operon FliA